jgi:serine/threonine protein kinase
MSVLTAQQEVGRLEREIARLQENKGRAAQKAARETKLANDAAASAARTTSLSTRRSKLRDAERHQDAAAKSHRQIADIESKIAGHQKRLIEARKKLARHDESVRQKEQAERKRESRLLDGRLETITTSSAETREREALLALIPIVFELMEGLETYATRLGDDRGVTARIVRSSHFGLLEPPVDRLYERWRADEPKIHNSEIRRLFRDLRFRQQVDTLRALSNSNETEWDETVTDMQASARRLDAALRSAAGSPARESSDTDVDVPGFTLVEKIGAGGYGEVWRAQERSPLKTTRAVKLLRPSPFLQDQNAAERFLREARALIELNHRAIVHYVSTGWTEGSDRTLYVVMEMVSGSPLRDCATTLAPQAKIMAMAEVLDGLEYAHSSRVFHRDVKPSNILIRNDGQPVLVDFGLVSFADLDSDLTNATLGSPGYIPPEVSADPRASRGPNHDIFAAGITLYEILAGIKPNIQEYRSLTEYGDELEGLDSVVLKALAKATDRFSTALDFASALRAWLDGAQPDFGNPDLSRIRTDPFRRQLVEAEGALSQGNPTLALIITAAVYDAMRICWSRAARRAGGVSLDGKERFMAATVSQPAMAVFREIRGYWQAPKLADDTFGPASLFAMGFSNSELARLRRLVDRAEELLSSEAADTKIDEADLAAGLHSLGVRLAQLEREDAAVFEPTNETV